MSRTMIQAHEQIFRILDEFCSARNDPVQNTGEIRYVAGPSKDEKAFLQDAQSKLILEFTAARRAILYDFNSSSYFCLVGFDGPEEFSSLREEKIDGGNFSAVIADLRPKPVGTTKAIRNVVEAQDKRLGKLYKGHSQAIISTLFPSVRIFSSEQVSNDEAYRTFFRFCLLECRFNDYWIDIDLADALIELCDVDSLKIPYQTLCRSIFDADPAALFLALYRCIEALYAVRTTNRLLKELGLEIEWDTMCTILERRLGWRAPEAASLQMLLVFCAEENLKGVLDAMGNNVMPEASSFAKVAGRQIYALRNALVHFRPIHHHAEFGAINWNVLCRSMASLVRNIYENVLLEPEKEDAFVD